LAKNFNERFCPLNGSDFVSLKEKAKTNGSMIQNFPFSLNKKVLHHLSNKQ
jgi:hypothetical protein